MVIKLTFQKILNAKICQACYNVNRSSSCRILTKEKVMKSLIERHPLFNSWNTRDSLSTVVNKIFDDTWNSFDKALDIVSIAAFPKVDVYTTKESYVIETDIPGLTKDEISVEVTGDNVLRISGEYSSAKEDRKVQIKELHKGRFERFIRLPDYIDGEPEGVYNNGKLILTWKLKVKTKEVRKKITLK